MNEISEKKRRGQKFSPDFRKRLLELIEKNPLLYEASNREHFTERVMIWEDIATKLNTSVAECKMAWKSLRRRHVLYKKSDLYKKRDPFSSSISEGPEFPLPFPKEEKLLSPTPAALSSTNISIINEEGLSTMPTVIKTSTNSTITTDGAISTIVFIPIVVSTPEVSTTATAPTSLSSKISKTNMVSQSSSPTSTCRTISTSKSGSKSTAINNSTPGTSSMDIKVNPLAFVPSQDDKSENLNTFFVTQDTIQQLLESKEKEEKQSDLVDDNKCITIDEGFIENPFNNQMTVTLSSDSCEINKNNMSTVPVNDKSLSTDEIGKKNFLAGNFTTSAQSMSKEMEKEDIDSTFHSEPVENNNFNKRIKNYFLCMADRMAGLPQYAQDGICLNISEIIDQARVKYLNK